MDDSFKDFTSKESQNSSFNTNFESKSTYPLPNVNVEIKNCYFLETKKNKFKKKLTGSFVVSLQPLGNLHESASISENIGLFGRVERRSCPTVEKLTPLERERVLDGKSLPVVHSTIVRSLRVGVLNSFICKKWVLNSENLRFKI